MRLGELTQSRDMRGRDGGPTVNEVSLVFHVPSFWLGICEAGNVPGVWWRASLEGSEIEIQALLLGPVQKIYSLERRGWAERRGLSSLETGGGQTLALTGL